MILLATSVVLLLSLVGLVGYWYGKREVKPVAAPATSQDGSSQTPQSRFPEKPSPQPVDETAGWKVYRSEKYGYEFLYPPSWNIIEKSRDYPESYKNDPWILQALDVTKSTKNLEEAVIYLSISDSKDTARSCSEDIKSYQRNKIDYKEVTIGGVQGIRAVFPMSESAAGDDLCVEYKGRRYNFQLNPGTLAERGKEDLATMNKILSTFKFLSSEVSTDGAANWKTYENAKYGFSVKYPEVFFKEEEINTQTAQVYALVSREEFGGGSEPIHYRIDFGELKNPSKLSFRNLATLGLDENLKSSFIYSQKIVGQYTAYTTESLPSRSGELDIFITKGKPSYLTITFSPYNSRRPLEGQEKYFGILDQILLTFKFLE